MPAAASGDWVGATIRSLVDSDISISDLSNAADVIAETNHGISGQKVVTYCNHFASKHNIRIPHAAYPFLAGNKRTALFENLRRFPPDVQYALVMQLCDDRTVAHNEAVQDFRRMLVDRYGHLARDEAGKQMTTQPPSRPLSAEPRALVPPAVVPVAPPWMSKPAPLKPNRPYDIFLSYSHEDEELMNLVRKHLVVYDRQGLIRKWWDRKLTAGAKFDGSIRHELTHSDIILLFVSASFLASDYCYEVEMKQALKQHESGQSVVVPVILRPCGWKAAPMIGDLLALPRDARPLVLWPDKDEAANNVADGVMGIVAELHAKTMSRGAQTPGADG